MEELFDEKAEEESSFDSLPQSPLPKRRKLTNVASLTWHLRHGTISRQTYLTSVYSNVSFIQRLDFMTSLEEHEGCVNTVHWNERGSLLVSGSDDTRICIWDYEQQKLRGFIASGHQSNIFCTRFMPASSDQTIISCAMDRTVRFFDLSRTSPSRLPHEILPAGTHVFQCHRGRVKKLATEANNPFVFLSCSEDATIRQFDVRQRHVCDDATECPNVLVDLSERSSYRGAVYSIALNQMNSNYLVAAGQGPLVQLFDRRMLLGGSNEWVKSFCPSGNPNVKSSSHITGVAYSYDGKEVLANYSGSAAFMFHVDDTVSNSKVTSSEGGEETTYAKMFEGHCNVRTYKEINFFGMRSEYVTSGSDDGRIFIWDKESAKIVQALKGDEDVVNCVHGHPHECVLASSGIENDVKLWAPLSPEPNNPKRIEEIVEHNNRMMEENQEGGAIPIHILQRLFREMQEREGGGEGPECHVQ